MLPLFTPKPLAAPHSGQGPVALNCRTALKDGVQPGLFSMKLLRLPRSKVQLGVPLPWSVRDKSGILLLSMGQVVETEHQLEQLLLLGAFVNSVDVVSDARQLLLYQSNKESVPISLLASWEQAPDFFQTLLTNPERKADFPRQAEMFALHILNLHDLNADFSLYRAVRQEKYAASNYGHTHSIHTATLCILLARHLGWPQERLIRLIKAALTMNMTILKLQGQMAAQNTPLTHAQRATIFSHPGHSVALLKTLGVDDAEWLSAIEQHHEHPDGTGYPAKITEIGDMAKVLHVTDVFMAKISPRVLRAALSPQDAIRQLYLEDKGGPISTGLIKSFGIYPPGDFVKLASGELAIVVERTANAKAPIVAAITDTAGRPASSTVRRDTGQAGFAITGVVADKSMLTRLLPERLYGLSIANPVHAPFAGFLMG